MPSFPITKNNFYIGLQTIFPQYIQSKDEKGYAAECRGSMVRADLSKKDDDDQLGMSFTTLFNCPVVVEKNTIAVLGFPYQGYIMRRAGGIPSYLPTKDELSKAIQLLPEDQFVDQMKEYYRRYHVGTEVRTEL